jgi:hypothetical protein
MAEEMTAGSGDVAGIGIGPQGEPGVTPKKNPILGPMVRRRPKNDLAKIFGGFPKKTFKQLKEELEFHHSYSGDDVKLHVSKRTKYPPTEFGMTAKEKAEKAAAAKEKREHDEYSLNHPFNSLKYHIAGTSTKGKGKGPRSGHHNRTLNK